MIHTEAEQQLRSLIEAIGKPESELTPDFNLWSSNCSNLDEFRKRVIDSPGFQLALNTSPTRFEVEQQDV